MNERNERIKELRKAVGLTQQDFADRIGIKRNSLANYETGRNTPLDAIVYSMVREFNVNEEWLRNGDGPMFLEHTRDDEIAEFAGRVLRDESDSFKRRFVAMLSHLDESDWSVLEKMVNEMKKD